MKITTLSEKQTINLGKKFSRQLQGGEVIGLIGELGAGKTNLIKGMGQGLEIKQTITSPTFVLMKVYPVNHNYIKWLCHVDAYRLKTGQDLIDIGIDDYLNNPNSITVIEWAEKIKNILPKKTIFVKIEFTNQQNQRIIKIE
jgi:tRNA threonylcarbamoyladenosine biosynthesis protein TsaE